mgnify:CR=1 FL=1
MFLYNQLDDANWQFGNHYRHFNLYAYGFAYFASLHSGRFTHSTIQLNNTNHNSFLYDYPYLTALIAKDFL